MNARRAGEPRIFGYPLGVLFFYILFGRDAGTAGADIPDVRNRVLLPAVDFHGDMFKPDDVRSLTNILAEIKPKPIDNTALIMYYYINIGTWG